MACKEGHPSLKRANSTDSSGSQGSKKLLFGEIPSSPVADGTRSSRSNSSICNLVMSTSSTFLRFWLSGRCRDSFLSHIDQNDLPNFRLVCHDFSHRVEKRLFEDISVTFKTSTFTKPARMEALERVGHHVRTVTFRLPHSGETFLPPLVDPSSGEQKSFVYEPQVHKPSSLAGRVKEPKYGSWEMTDLLIKQYPPLFHAATNIPAFIQAFSALPSLRHLKISCPGHESSQRYRRSVVDYALISLRIAVERAPLHQLRYLSLLPIHPGGAMYLQPMLGFGATPASTRRWAQIRRLIIHMESFPFDKPSKTEHLRILHNYLRTFSTSLTRLFFRWKGEKGPCPFTLELEPCLLPGNVEPTSTKSCALRSLRFPRLRLMELENAVTDASQISTFISRHRRSLTEFNFEDVTLRSGCWDDALSPLTRISGSDEWRKKQEEVMDVPVMLSPGDVEPCIEGPLMEPEKVERNHMSLSKWIAKGRSSATARKLKEQFFGSSEHMKKFLRASVFT